MISGINILTHIFWHIMKYNPLVRVYLPLKLCAAILASICPFTNVKAASLDALIHGALISYPSIHSRQAMKDSAQSDLTAAKLRFLPAPSFGTQRNQVHFDGATNSGRMPSTNVSVSQPLLLDGGIVAGYKKAESRLSAADYAVLEAREDVARRVINTYAEWLKAWKKILALEDSVRLHERLVGQVSRRHEQGVASGSDKDLAISRLMQAKADLDAQFSLELSALSSLSELVGGVITRKDLIAKVTTYARPPIRSDGIARAQNQSPTVHRLIHEAEAAQSEAKEIRAQALPQLSFQAQRQIGNAYYPGAQGFNAVGLVVNYVPGGGLSSIPASSAAFERARGAMLQAESAKRELADRLASDYNEYEFSLLKKESIERSAILSGEIGASYDRQFFVGRKSWLDLMNVVREQAQTKVQLADIEGSLLAASWRLIIYVDGTSSFDYLPEKLPNQKKSNL